MGTQPLRQLDTIVQCAVGRQHNKFFTTPAPQIIGIAQAGRCLLSNDFEHPITRFVPMHIIETFEIVDIK